MPHEPISSTSRSSHRTPPRAASEDNVHVCKAGDTMWDIARAHGVSLKALQKANPQIADGRTIFTGTHVHIPARSTGGDGAAHAPARSRTPATPDQQAGGRSRAAAMDDETRRRIQSHGAAGAHAAHQAHVAHEAHQAHAARTGLRPDPDATSTKKASAAGSTKGMTEAQKFDHYKSVIEQNGGKFHSEPNARNLVGLRHETNANAHGGRGAIDDKFVMLWQDKNGRKHVKEYSGTTEGNDVIRRGYSDDVNHDGSRDLGRIPTGHYEYYRSTSSKLGDVLRPSHAFQVQRDFNHDGKYAGNKELHADTSAAFLFHAGSSAGCQTMDHATFSKFWRDLNSSGRGGKIGYTLLNV